MKKINFTSQIMRLSSLIVLFMTLGMNLGAQCLEKATVYLDPNSCSYTLTLADVRGAAPLSIRKLTTAGAQAYVAGYNNGSFTGSSIIFGRNDIGKEFEIMTGTGNAMCFHYVQVLDRDAPVAAAPAPVSIKCTDLVNGKIPAPAVLGSWKGADGLGQVLNPISSNLKWTANDCSDFRQSWDDEYLAITPCNADGCSYQTVIRHWTLKDIYGNASYYDQTVYVKSPLITIPGVAPGATTGTLNIFDCTADASTVGLPLINWAACGVNADNEGVIFNKDYCGRAIDKISEVRMNLCPGSYMLTRVYKVNNCGVFSTVTQVINVWDRTTPSVRLAYNDYLRQKENQCYIMNGMEMTEFVYKTVVTPISVTAGNQTANTVATATSIASYKVTPLVSSTQCNSASIAIAYTVSDPRCSNGKISLYSDNSAIRFNGMTTMTVESGTTVGITGSFESYPGQPDPIVRIYAKDECGNITEVKLTIVIYDNVSPTSICEDKQVSLTNNGEAVVAPTTFSGGSYDNCCDSRRNAILPAAYCTRQLIRKTGTNCWYDLLTFKCEDVGDFKVDIRTIDGCGNYSDCCVTAHVINKQPISCASYMDVATVCTDARLSNLNNFFTTPTSFATCGSLTVTSSTTPLNLVCGEGSATRTWTFTQGSQSVQCSQTLTVTAVKGFRIKPLVDETYTCSGYTYDEARERQLALNQVKLLNAQGAATCSAPVVEVEKWEYSNTQFCKIIRIRYTFVDKCSPYCGLQDDANNEYLYLNFGQTGLNNLAAANYTRDADGFYQASSNLSARFTPICTNNGYIFFGYERFVMINDKTAPTSVTPTIADICFPDNRCSFDFPAITLNGSDKCDDGSVTGSNLTIVWSVINPSGSTIARGNGTTTATTGVSVASSTLNNLAGGTYTVRYSVADFCGNINWYSFTVRGKDCKTPFVLVHEKNLELGYDLATRAGMGQVCVDDVLNNLGDNCTGYDFLYSKTGLQRAADAAVYSDALPKCLMFTCADKDKVVAVRVWTRDEAGNNNFVLTYITVQDNKNACSVVPLSTIAGTLRTENNQAVKDVVVSGSINGVLAGSGTTDAAGSFSLQTTLDQNVQVKAVKIATEDKYAGVTTFDIARISKHLLDIEKFSSPYSVIAADVNKDGEVDATDMLQIRNFILRKTTTLPGGVWRFVDASYKFTNPANPFGEDFPEVVNLSKVPATATANFTAIKLGDVNTTYVSALTGVQVRNSNSLVLQAEDMQLVAGNEYTVNITADNFNAIAFQGTISMNGATVKSVKAGDLANYNDGNFGVFANEITTSWNGASKLNANVMSITFVANKSAKLSEVLTVGNSLTPAVANDIAGNEMNVNLKFTTGKVVGGEFALYQNTPNPVALETTIGFNLPKDESARLTVYSVDGKTILAKQIDGKAGVNQITINKSELNANGVMYYRLETAEHTATKKMVIIE